MSKALVETVGEFQLVDNDQHVPADRPTIAITLATAARSGPRPRITQLWCWASRLVSSPERPVMPSKSASFTS